MTKVALLIGVGNYEHPDALKPLVSAPKDVAAMQRILLNAQMGEFSEVTPLIDPDPMQMQEAIEALYRDRAKDDLVLLFFSGHGIKDDSGKLYFSTRVTRKTPKGELVKSTAVPARFVQEIMGNSRSRRQVMILDCCFSGAFDPALNAKDDGSLDVQGQLGAEGRVVLTSSSSTEYSFEQQGSDLSIYTRFLVEGIETGAADQDNDGKVSVRELHEYATKKVQETAPKMNPKIIVLRDEGFDVVFAKAQIADPKLKYRKDAERYAMRGEISSIGRTVLNTQRVRLGLTLEEAQAIEDQVLQPFRERLKHLEHYRSTFAAEVERQYPITPQTLSELKDLQEVFGLREEDVAQIEQEVTTQVTSQSEAYQQKLQRYEQEFTKAILAEFPLSQSVKEGLYKIQVALGLTDKDIARIEQASTEHIALEDQQQVTDPRQKQQQPIGTQATSVSLAAIANLQQKAPQPKIKLLLGLATLVVIGSLSVGIKPLFQPNLPVPLIPEKQPENNNPTDNEVKTYTAGALKITGNRQHTCDVLLPRGPGIGGSFSYPDEEAIWKNLRCQELYCDLSGAGCRTSLKSQWAEPDKEGSGDSAIPLNFVDQIIQFPDQPIPVSTEQVDSLRPQQVTALNALLNSFNKVDNTTEPVVPRSSTTYGDWDALCIGEKGQSRCPKSAKHEILSYGNFADNKQLWTSRGWVLYKP
ncbi:MAG: caspase domain-containing protein [Stenomitos frigidus ULC029]